MDKTIAAIATGEQSSGIAIIRMSGDKSLEIIDKVFKGKSSPLSKAQSHTIHYGHIYNNNKIIDEVLVSIFLAPRSYTAENTVEINCHGGILNTRKVLETLFDNGAFPAEAGEFTKRAFLNGRIDLSEAEAVADIINADNNLSLNNAQLQLSGRLSQKIKLIRADLLHTTAAIESALDDPEHYNIDSMTDKIKDSLANCRNIALELYNSYDNGRIISTGIRTVILGSANVGKSSLLNYLSGQESAIVTDIAGTTRDLIKENINIGDLTLNITDTAGIRDTVDPVEQIGIERSIQAIDTADLVLMVVDASKRIEDSERKLIESVLDKKIIVLLNKTDLNTVTTPKDIESISNNVPIIEISIKKETGMNKLKSLITEMFTDNAKGLESGLIITTLRQKYALKQAIDSLQMALDTIHNRMPEDLLLPDIMQAYKSFGEIIGEAINDDLVNEIFSKFCMGK